jgi:DNA-binding response OmpR family regulator
MHHTSNPDAHLENAPQVCKEIRRTYKSVNIPIIMVSAKSNPEDVMEGLHAGANDYVKKPFHRQELLTRVLTQVRNR